MKGILLSELKHGQIAQNFLAVRILRKSNVMKSGVQHTVFFYAPQFCLLIHKFFTMLQH